MDLQFNTVLEKGKLGVTRGRKANGSADADGRVADMRKWFFQNPSPATETGFFMPQKLTAVSYKRNIQVGGGP